MCAGAALAGTGPNSRKAVSGFNPHVAKEGESLTKDQMLDNWALGGGDEPEYFEKNPPQRLARFGGFFKDMIFQERRNKWYSDRKAEWKTNYDNIGKDYKPSLDIPNKSSKEQKFYGSDGSTWKD